MNLTIIPSPLSGTVTPPPSKSQLHRLILGSALAQGESTIENAALSDDITATLRCITALGASWTLQGTTLHISGGIARRTDRSLPVLDCRESGSTLRFLIPIALATAGGGIFTGQGRLMDRPLEPYLDIFREKNIAFQKDGNVLTIQGRLTPGEYSLKGNVSSQFFSGLLFALPLLDDASTLVPTTALESEGYIHMTLDALSRFGISISGHTSPLRWQIPGSCSYLPCTVSAEADWSQAAFWYAADDTGDRITIDGTASNSLQGDSVFPQWMQQIRRGGDLTICAAQTPDLVPPLAAGAATMDGTLRITGISRLRLKESDRIAAITAAMAALGADVTEENDCLLIRGRNTLVGGTTDTFGDHRIAMMAAIAAAHCESPVTLTGAECVAKSYPHFWDDYKKLGGIVLEHTGK